MQNTLLYEKKMFWFKLKLALFIILLWWLVAVFNMYLGFSLSNFSLKPHNISQWFGIFTYPFVHGNLEHLMNNSLSGFLIFASLFLIYEKISLKVLLIIYIVSGLILWFLGQNGSMHIGASGVIYGVAFFLILSGFIVGKSANLAISFFMVAWYGSMIWGIFPFSVEEGVSWEGHLSGAIVGIILALYFHKENLPKKKSNSTDEIEDEFHFFERYPLE